MVLSKKTQTPSFIFGTIHHLGPKPVLDNKELMRIIMRCKLIVQEADTTELLHSTHPGFDFTSDTALDELLGYSDYQYVKYEFFKATGKDIEQYKFRMPQAIMLMIEKGKKDKEIYKSKMPLMENAFYALSVVKKIPIKGLETRQDIFKCFCKVDDMNHYTAPGDSTIILKRNLFWIKNIRNYIEQGNVFIAVGAAHLCGNFGIISLLKKDGYTIVPVMTK
ncbi:MAG: TraB/GumN family protein [Bacteroidetes bacterium]|nr:TraB/GumN family protein [Bacteroidota bacterium]